MQHSGRRRARYAHALAQQFALVAPLVSAAAATVSPQDAWPVLCRLDEQLAALLDRADARPAAWAAHCATHLGTLPLLVLSSLQCEWPAAPADKAVELLRLALQPLPQAESSAGPPTVHHRAVEAGAAAPSAVATVPLEWLGLPVPEPPGQSLPQLLDALRATPMARFVLQRCLEAASSATRAAAAACVTQLLARYGAPARRQLLLLVLGWLPQVVAYGTEGGQYLEMLQMLFAPASVAGSGSTAAASPAGSAAASAAASPASAAKMSIARRLVMLQQAALAPAPVAQAASPPSSSSALPAAAAAGSASASAVLAAFAAAAPPGPELLALLAPDEIASLVASLSAALAAAAGAAASHPHAPAYAAIQRLLEPEGRFLGLDDSTVLSEASRQYSWTPTKVDAIKAEIKYSDKRVIVRLNGWYSITGFQLAIENPRRSKCVRTLQMFYCSQPVSDLQVRRLKLRIALYPRYFLDFVQHD